MIMHSTSHKRKLFLLFFWYGLTTLALFLFSYTQVDLNLTLSRVSIWQMIQKTFQHIGYYERPWATGIYIGIVCSYIGAYVYTMYGIKQSWFTKKHMWRLILGITFLLVFAYPATSYDIFNHMFTAKTVLIYHQNPYAVTPLQFAGVEPWLTFMRWTHVVSIYSPLWIACTLLPYLLGFGYFLLILWSFKLFIACFYLLCVWAIEHILSKEGEEQALLGMAAFALNPLVIIESLVGAHNDIVMMGFAMVAVYLWEKRDMMLSFSALSLSIATKLMTVLLLPMYFFRKRWLSVVLMSMGLVGFLVVTRREVMPWYFLWVMPFIALFPRKRWLITIAYGISFGLLLRYAPFFYFGHWNDPVPMMKVWATVIPILCTFVIAGWQARKLLAKQ